MADLCGAYYRRNMGVCCGKESGHLAYDPFHKFVPGINATLEWLDYDTYRTSDEAGPS